VIKLVLKYSGDKNVVLKYSVDTNVVQKLPNFKSGGFLSKEKL
jgi:hypothetical protein